MRSKTTKKFSSWLAIIIAAYPNERTSWKWQQGTGNSGRTWSLEHRFFPPENTTCSWCFTTLCILSVNSWSNESVKGYGHLWGNLIAAAWPCHCLAVFCNCLSSVKLIVWSRTKWTCSFIERRLRSDLNLFSVNGTTVEMCNDSMEIGHNCSAIRVCCVLGMQFHLLSSITY